MYVTLAIMEPGYIIQLTLCVYNYNKLNDEDHIWHCHVTSTYKQPSLFCLKSESCTGQVYIFVLPVV